MTLPCGNEEEITRLDIFPVHQLLDRAIKRRRAQFFPGKPSRQADTQLRIGFRIQYVPAFLRSEEHTSELQSLMRISYAVFCVKKNKHTANHTRATITNIHIIT